MPHGLFTIVAVQTRSETIPPELFLRGSGIFVRSLNKQGDGWETSNQDADATSSDEWAAFRLPGYPAGGVTLRAVLKTDTQAALRSYWFCYTKGDGHLLVVKQTNVLSSQTSTSQTKDLGAFPFIGAFQRTAADEIFVAHQVNGNLACQKLSPPSTGTTLQAVQLTVSTALNKVQRIAASYGSDAANQRRILYQRSETGSVQQDGNFRALFTLSAANLTESETSRIAPHVTGPFEITEQLSEAELVQREEDIQAALEVNQSGPRSNRTYLEEAYYFVPVQLALQLQQQGHYIAALDWFQTVYAHNLPANLRKIYYGLVLEGSLTNKFDRTDDWLLQGLNPHEIVTNPLTSRVNAYTRFTIISLARCCLDFADAEFARETRESIASARSLYMTALELLGLPEMQDSGGGTTIPLLVNPVLQALSLRGELNLFKIRIGLNIAGLSRQFEPQTQQSEAIASLPAIGNGGQLILPGAVSLRPTPYRYGVLIERAKQLVTIAEQIEAAFLSALEKRDAEAFTLLKARQDMELSRAGVRLQDLRVREAEGGVKLAELQQRAIADSGQ